MPVPDAPDAEALAVAWLAAHPKVQALAAEVDGLANVGTDVVGPYPMVQVTQTPVNATAGRGGPMWIDGPELAVNAWAAPPGEDPPTDKPALRALVYAAVHALAELPDREHDEDDPVVTDVRLSFGPGWLPDQDTQQARYAAGVVLHLHPPRS